MQRVPAAKRRKRLADTAPPTPAAPVEQERTESATIVDQRLKIRDLLAPYLGLEARTRGFLLALLLQEAKEPELAKILSERYQLSEFSPLL